MRWVLHGGPGTGKTHVIKLLRAELFEKLLGWSRGVEFDITALQAVTADMLDGDTLHHAFGLSWSKSGSRAPSLSKTLALAQRLLRMRWLVIDEISMVSVELLAQLEQKLRQLIRQGSPFKRRNGRTRPFGGLNVVVVGDLWQLEPPGGTFIASLPHEWLQTAGAKQRMLQAHGQELIWGGPEKGFQGVTELWRCERVKDDEWLKELQEQFRYSRLTDDNHAFLHGRPTAVPGSWTREALTCGNEACQTLVRCRATPDVILGDECRVCKEERRTRRLVATSAKDPRFSKGFEASPSIFATNTRKCHTGKLRAKAFAGTRNKHLHYIVAHDRASAAVLCEKPDLTQENKKLQWLQRHDRECGDLCGMLPLCDGMPVFLTEHINRDRLLLKGRRGFVRTWTPAADGAEEVDGSTTVWNQLPASIFVQFPGATWKVADLEKGVYPVVPLKRTWHLDAKRQAPQLAVQRTQLPLLPAFAITAHGAQGQTLSEGVIADLVLGAVSSVLTAYVAITRVTERARLLILRAFAAETFQQGDKSFRSLLLQQWRHHDVNWEEVLGNCVKTRVCNECRAARLRRDYTAANWNCSTDDIVCRECTKAYRERGTPFRCWRCHTWRAQEAFRQPVTNINLWRSVCQACIQKRECNACGLWLEKNLFARSAWGRKRNRTCSVCRNWSQYLVIAANAQRRLRRRRHAQASADLQTKRKAVLREIWQEVKRKKPVVCPHCTETFLNSL